MFINREATCQMSNPSEHWLIVSVCCRRPGSPGLDTTQKCDRIWAIYNDEKQYNYTSVRSNLDCWCCCILPEAMMVLQLWRDARLLPPSLGVLQCRQAGWSLFNAYALTT